MDDWEGAAIALGDGRALFYGGRTAAIYEGDTGAWRRRRLGMDHWASTLTRLPDGRILALDGANLREGPAERGFVFDPTEDDWAPIDHPPFGVHRAAVLGDDAVLVVHEGGAHRLDLATDEWRPLSGIDGRREAMVVARDGAVWVAGGWLDGPWRREAWRIDARGVHPVAPLPAPLEEGVALALPDGVLVLGEVDDAPARAFLHPADGEGWRSLPPLAAERIDAAVALDDRRVLVIGGWRDGSWILDLDEGAWTPETRLPARLSDPSLVRLDQARVLLRAEDFEAVLHLPSDTWHAPTDRVLELTWKLRAHDGQALLFGGWRLVGLRRAACEAVELWPRPTAIEVHHMVPLAGGSWLAVGADDDGAPMARRRTDGASWRAAPPPPFRPERLVANGARAVAVGADARGLVASVFADDAWGEVHALDGWNRPRAVTRTEQGVWIAGWGPDDEPRLARFDPRAGAFAAAPPPEGGACRLVAGPDGGLWAFSGGSGAGPSRWQRLDEEAGRWIDGPQPNAPRRCPAVVRGEDGAVHAVGGDHGEAVTVERLPAGADAWEPPRAIPLDGVGAAAVLADGVLAVFGEAGGRQELLSVGGERAPDAWPGRAPDPALFAGLHPHGAARFAGACPARPAPPMPLARQGLTAARLRDGRVLVLGGVLGPEHRQVHVIAPGERAWSSAAPLPEHVFVAAAAGLPGGDALVVGRHGTRARFSLHRWRARSDEWTPVGEGWRGFREADLVVREDGTAVVAGGGLRVVTAGGAVRELGLPTAPRGHPAHPRSRIVRTRANRAEGQRWMAMRATLLDDGAVLITGGRRRIDGEPRMEERTLRVDPDAGTVDEAAPMQAGRAYHRATRLADGRVLVTGGMVANPSVEPDENGNVRVGDYNLHARGTAACEIYDPRTGAWSSASAMHEPRYHHTATRLPDGRVLVVGGVPARPHRGPRSSTAELYDPSTDRWTRVELGTGRTEHAAVALDDGTVWLIGGRAAADYASEHALAFHLGDDCFAVAPASLEARFLTPLADGTVLAIDRGGSIFRGDAAGRWTLVPGHVPGFAGAALLEDGRVLVAGRDSATLVDPDGGTTPIAPPLGRLVPSVVLPLADGRVWVASRRAGWATIWDPARDAWARTPPSRLPGIEDATLLGDGRVLAVHDRSARVFDPARGEWAPGPDLPLSIGRGGSLDLLPDGRVMLVAGEGVAWLGLEGRWRTGPARHGRRGHHTLWLPDRGLAILGGSDPARAREPYVFAPARDAFDPLSLGARAARDFRHAAGLGGDGAIVVATPNGALERLGDR
ncbi:MAG TPA: kelch repeat-containing protein [Sandaracinaceae bacterium LLY-WYZ-13_1]|nr:kelch repeat-containing protein [Sandaracinaceae bacterium LLY-WYZ-13_1]